MSVTPGFLAGPRRSICEIASATPGTVNAASADFGILGRQRPTAASRLADRLGDLSRVAAGPDAGAVDAAAAAVDEDAVDHDVEVLFPLIDLVVAEEDLGEARAVRLHARVALYCSTVAVPPKIRLAAQLSSTAAPTSAPPG